MTDIQIEQPEVVEEEQFLITLEWDRRSGEPPHAECTCGKFKTDPTTNMARLGVLSFAHRDQTGHKLREHAQPDGE
jgi:hypothetical protein